MSRKVILTCAVTGDAPFNRKHPAMPVTPAQIADACLEAARAGRSERHFTDPFVPPIAVKPKDYTSVKPICGGTVAGKYFECLACHTITLIEASQATDVKPPKCSKCGGGTGLVRPNIKAGDTITSRLERRKALRLTG